MNLCDISTVKDLLLSHGLQPRKSFGQNFLINKEVPERIAMSSVLGEDAYKSYASEKGSAVLEIGPGLGTMTRELCELYDKVVAVEIDRGMISVLSETLADFSNVTVVNEDFMKLNLAELFSEQFGGEGFRVCANLPYYITTPILMALLEYGSPARPSPVKSVTVLVQAEVADRLCAAAGSDDYGAITAAVALSGRAKKLFDVSAGNFYPAPKVTSSVVHIELYENGIRDGFDGLPADDEELEKLVATAKKLISLGFNQRRKTLLNSASSLAPKEKLKNALEALNIRADIRAESLSAGDFLKLASLLK